MISSIKYIFIISLMLISYAGHAQSCTYELIRPSNNSWSWAYNTSGSTNNNEDYTGVSSDSSCSNAQQIKISRSTYSPISNTVINNSCEGGRLSTYECPQSSTTGSKINCKDLGGDSDCKKINGTCMCKFEYRDVSCEYQKVCPTPTPSPTALPITPISYRNCTCYLFNSGAYTTIPTLESSLYQPGGKTVSMVLWAWRTSAIKDDSCSPSCQTCSKMCHALTEKSAVDSFFNGNECDAGKTYLTVGYENGKIQGTYSDKIQTTLSNCSAINNNISEPTYPAPKCPDLENSSAEIYNSNGYAPMTNTGRLGVWKKFKDEWKWECDYGTTKIKRTACIPGDTTNDYGDGSASFCFRELNPSQTYGELKWYRKYNYDVNAPEILPPASPKSCNCYMLQREPSASEPYESNLSANNTILAHITNSSTSIDANSCHSYCSGQSSYNWTFHTKEDCAGNDSYDVYSFFDKKYTGKKIANYQLSCATVNYDTIPTCPSKPNGITTQNTPIQASMKKFIPDLLTNQEQYVWTCDFGSRTDADGCLASYYSYKIDNVDYCYWSTTNSGVQVYGRYGSLSTTCPAGTTPNFSNPDFSNDMELKSSCNPGTEISIPDCWALGGITVVGGYCKYKSGNITYVTRTGGINECPPISITTDATATGTLPKPVLDPSTAQSTKKAYVCNYGISADSSSCRCLNGFLEGDNFNCTKEEDLSNGIRKLVYNRSIDLPKCLSIASTLKTTNLTPIATWNSGRNIWECNYGNQAQLTAGNEQCIVEGFRPYGSQCTRVDQTQIKNCQSGATSKTEDIHRTYKTGVISCAEIAVATSIKNPIATQSGNDFICNYGESNQEATDCKCQSNFSDDSVQVDKCQKEETIAGSNNKKILVYSKKLPAPKCYSTIPNIATTLTNPTAENTGSTNNPSAIWNCNYGNTTGIVSTCDSSSGFNSQDGLCVKESTSGATCGQTIRTIYSPKIHSAISAIGCPALNVKTTTPKPKLEITNVANSYICQYGETTSPEKGCLREFETVDTFNCNQSKTVSTILDRQLVVSSNAYSQPSFVDVKANITYISSYQLKLAPQGATPKPEPLGITTDIPAPKANWVDNRWQFNYGKRVDTSCILGVDWTLRNGICIFESGASGTAEAITKYYAITPLDNVCPTLNGVTPSAIQSETLWVCDYGDIEQSKCPGNWIGVTLDESKHICSSRPNNQGVFNKVFLKYLLTCPEDKSLSTSKPTPKKENDQWICDYGSQNAISCPITGQWEANGNICQATKIDSASGVSFKKRYKLKPSACPYGYSEIKYTLNTNTSNDFNNKVVCLDSNKITQLACGSHGGVIKSWSDINDNTNYCLLMPSNQSHITLKEIQKASCPINTIENKEMTLTFGKLTCNQSNFISEADCLKMKDALVTDNNYCKYSPSGEFFYLKEIGEANPCFEIGLDTMLGSFNSKPICWQKVETRERAKCSIIKTLKNTNGNNQDFCLEQYKRKHYKAYIIAAAAPTCPTGTKQLNPMTCLESKKIKANDCKLFGKLGDNSSGETFCTKINSDGLTLVWEIEKEKEKTCPSNYQTLEKNYMNGLLPLCKSNTPIPKSSCVKQNGYQKIIAHGNEQLCIIKKPDFYFAGPLTPPPTCANAKTPPGCKCELRDERIFFNCKTEEAKRARKDVEYQKKLDRLNR